VLSGYPALELLAPSGDAIPTDDVRATDGAYLFPAIPESIVVLEPGEDASFQLAYAANPFGPLATATLDVACPRSTALGVELPDGDGSITVSLELRACNHWLAATPWFPGSTWVGFDAIEP
jgi:hypothetical protein